MCRGWRYRRSAPDSCGHLLIFENLGKELARRRGATDVERVAARRLLNKSQITIPTEIVQHELEALSFARGETRDGEVEYLPA